MTNVSSATTRLHPHPPAQMPPKSQLLSHQQPAEVWEPQVKQYSNMNLKDQAKRERQTLAEAADEEAAQDAGTFILYLLCHTCTVYILGDKFCERVFMEIAKCLHIRCGVIACVVVCSGRGQGEEAEASEEASG